MGAPAVFKFVSRFRSQLTSGTHLLDVSDVGGRDVSSLRRYKSGYWGETRPNCGQSATTTRAECSCCSRRMSCEDRSGRVRWKMTRKMPRRTKHRFTPKDPRGVHPSSEMTCIASSPNKLKRSPNGVKLRNPRRADRSRRKLFHFAADRNMHASRPRRRNIIAHSFAESASNIPGQTAHSLYCPCTRCPLWRSPRSKGARQTTLCILVWSMIRARVVDVVGLIRL